MIGRRVTKPGPFRLLQNTRAVISTDAALLVVFSVLPLILDVKDPWWLSKASMLTLITKMKTELSIVITLERFLASVRVIQRRGQVA